MKTNAEVIQSELLSMKDAPRYVIVEKDTHNLIDDAHGYGYKTAESAEKALWYKAKNGLLPKKQKPMSEQRRTVKEWFSKHFELNSLLGLQQDLLVKDVECQDCKLSLDTFKRIMKQANVEIKDMPYSPSVMLREWNTLNRVSF